MARQPEPTDTMPATPGASPSGFSWVALVLWPTGSDPGGETILRAAWHDPSRARTVATAGHPRLLASLPYPARLGVVPASTVLAK